MSGKSGFHNQASGLACQQDAFTFCEVCGWTAHTESLQEQVAALQEQLAAIQKRLVESVPPAVQKSPPQAIALFAASSGSEDGTACTNSSISILDAYIEDCDLSVRATVVLQNYGVRLVRQLTQCTLGQLWQMRQMGRKTITEIGTFLAAHGLSLREA